MHEEERRLTLYIVQSPPLVSEGYLHNGGLLGFFASLCKVTLICVLQYTSVHLLSLTESKAGESFKTGNHQFKGESISISISTLERTTSTGAGDSTKVKCT